MDESYLLDQADVTWDQAGHPFASTFNDVYYSKENGRQEKEFVFLGLNELKSRWQSLPATVAGHFTLVETGFGTGLNFLLTYKLWRETAPASWQLHYLSIEKHPLTRVDLERALRELSPDMKGDELLSIYPDPSVGFHRRHFTHNVNLTLLYADVLHCLDQLSCAADAWFLDGFAPRANPEMWSEQCCARMFQLSRAGATFSTFSAAGWVRRGMQSAGFEVRKQPGFGRKKELLCGLKPGTWRPAKHTRSGKVAVIGAGLAGTSCAYALARRGFSVSLIDRASSVAQGATGMHQLAFYPQLASNPTWQSLYSLQAFQYTAHHLQKLSDAGHMDWQPCGFLMLDTHDRDRAQHSRLRRHFDPPNEIATWMNPEKAAQTAGLQIADGGFYFPKAGWVDPKQLCAAQIQHPHIEVIHGREVASLAATTDGWSLLESDDKPLLQATSVVIANGHRASRFDQCRALPLTSVRGQTSLIPSNIGLQGLKAILGGSATLFPSHGEIHNLAATYDPDDDDMQSRDSDRRLLQESLQGMISADYGFDSNAALVGIRAVSRDRFPVTGALPEWRALTAHYRPLQRNANAVVPRFEANLPGLYIATAFGSHGLNQIPLCAEHLASTMCGDPDPLPQSMAELISPIRFLIRDLKKQLVDTDDL
jgi:tRNA 5-methylaminomethyl-2-thiouridine biosynthesis bifunctional protein|tara:strand:+ start:4166 stop:6118 length:1953 start_codon:yes stop_codon:yes gene_type:complete